MRFIDANVFIGLQNQDDVFHAKARELMAAIETGRYGEAFTSDYVFNEVVGVTNRKQGKYASLKIGDLIRNSTFLLNINGHQLDEAWKIFTKTKLPLSLVDCTNLVALKLANTTFIATFDKQFEKIKGVEVVCF